MTTIIDPLLRLPQIKAATGLGRSSIYAFIARREFPAPVRLGRRAVAWRASDIATWLAGRQPTRGAA